MSNLMEAGLLRLKREKLFWCLTALMGISAIALCLGQYPDIARYRAWVEAMPENEFYAELLHDAMDLGTMFFQWAGVIGQVLAVLAGVYIGTEYSDGTMRNKVMAGHKRSHIYLSGFLLCTLGGALFGAVFMGAALLAGLPFFGWEMGAAETAMYLFCGFMETMAFAAVCNLISMLVPNRTYGLIVNLFVVTGLCLAGIVVMNMLAAPEFINDASMSIDGVPVQNYVPNPRYLSGDTRRLFQFILDVLPSGQGYQLAGRSVWCLERMWLCSAAVTAAVNMAGCRAFQRKNLK